MKRGWSLIALLALLTPHPSHAQWMSSGKPLTTVPGVQQQPNAVPDGQGGTLVVWEDARFGTANIAVQKIDASGVAQWVQDGVVVCTGLFGQEFPAVVSDGAGGAIVAWEDLRGANWDVRAQRVNAAGAVQWTANGVVVSAATGNQQGVSIVSDGAGGAIVLWLDFRAGNNDIYAQRINAAGAVQWAANGLPVVDEGNHQVAYDVVADGAGGAIAVWADYRFGVGDIDIFAQRVNSAGARQWGLWGTGVCNSLGVQGAPTVTNDGAGGTVFAWQDNRSLIGYDIYAQRLNAAGSSQWTFNGVLLCDANNHQEFAAIAPDGAGGAIVAWTDDRVSNTFDDVYAQRVSATGAPLWTADGILVCDASTAQNELRSATDGVGGVVLAWNDTRFGQSDFFVQRVNSMGEPMWSFNGVNITTSTSSTNQTEFLADGAGGLVGVWVDARSGEGEIYAQRVESVYGFWGRPEPIIQSVADVRNDQGGKVAVDWEASGRDTYYPLAIDFYSVWRAVDAPLPSGARVLSGDELETVRTDDDAPVFYSTPNHFFERIGTQTAHGWPGYSFSASTRADSVAASESDEVFMVAAHYLGDDYIAFASNEVSGHSVDNLAPLAPFLLTAHRVGSDVHLNWNRAVAPDLRDYSIYRATLSGVTPVPINFLESAEDTLAVDANAPSSALYYIVTAYDVHANQSAPSNEASVNALTGVGNTPSLTSLTVPQNHPNPFSATTDFEIGLPSSSDVSIEVFDVAGRLVSVLAAQGVKGWQKIPFAGRDERGRPLASGVYFYRVNAAGATITRKMVITR